MKLFAPLVLACALAAIPATASADFSLALGTTINGTSPNGTAPFVTATYRTVAPGTVTLTLSASGLTSGEFVSEFLFNVAPSITPNSLTFDATSGPVPTISASTQDAYNGGNQIKGGLFDVLLSYNNNVLTSTSASSVITITGAGITAESFLFGSTPVQQGSNIQGPYLAVADIRGIPGSSSGSIGTITPSAVPEPSSLALCGIAGLAGLAVRHRARKLSAA